MHGRRLGGRPDRGGRARRGRRHGERHGLHAGPHVDLPTQLVGGALMRLRARGGEERQAVAHTLADGALVEEALVERLVRNERDVRAFGLGVTPLEAQLVAVLARYAHRVLRTVHTEHLVDHTGAPALRDGLLKPLVPEGRPDVVDLHLVGFGARHDGILVREDRGIRGRVDGRRAILDCDELLVLDGMQIELHLVQKTHQRRMLRLCGLSCEFQSVVEAVPDARLDGPLAEQHVPIRRLTQSMALAPRRSSDKVLRRVWRRIVRLAVVVNCASGERRVSERAGCESAALRAGAHALSCRWRATTMAMVRSGADEPHLRT
eukprot:scaffold24401_cov115-Isochrysis_galbana.AAC.7